ncbi:MAG: CRISPR-associated CARF protein Csa3 [Candidatus Nanoarchaeia archaeon]|nr:CRISPR-associated CARF protein Csa3 [Candidatus Nanoarchaeia archaeon]
MAKIVFVGASTVNLYGAKKLKEKGHEVIVYEKNKTFVNNHKRQIKLELLEKLGIPCSKDKTQYFTLSVIKNILSQGLDIEYNKEIDVNDELEYDYMIVCTGHKEVEFDDERIYPYNYAVVDLTDIHGGVSLENAVKKMDDIIEDIFLKEGRIVNGSMETFIKDLIDENDRGKSMKRILISTLFNPDPVLLSCTKLSPDKLILLVTDEPDETIEKSLELIKNSLGRVIDVSTVKIPQYDIVKIASKVVDIIDKVHFDGQIIINITSGRKTQSMGVLFGAYARAGFVKKIAYYPEGDKKGEVVYLPILSIKLTESQEKIMDGIKSNKIASHKTLADSTGLSTAMVYRAVDDLISQGLVEKTEDEGIVLTDAGKIARL